MYNKTLVDFDDSYVGYKIMIYPTDEQKILFEKYFDTCRIVYNLGIMIEEKYYQEAIENNYQYSFLSFISLRNKINELKTTDKYLWLNDYNNDTIAMVVKDVINAYKRFFNRQCARPRFKSKKNYYKQFPVRADRLSIQETTVRISSIG